MEKISIRNFGGIEALDLEIKPINVYIGPQGSGKSVTIKLLYFFKAALLSLPMGFKDSLVTLNQNLKRTFKIYFPESTWPQTDFMLNYEVNNLSLEITSRKGELLIKLSKELEDLISRTAKAFHDEKASLLDSPFLIQTGILVQIASKYWEKLKTTAFGYLLFNQVFIPAGRSFYAQMQKNIFGLVGQDLDFDPFISKFGQFYEKVKRNESYIQDPEMDQLADQILRAKYVRENEQDFLKHEDQRKIHIAQASSGQQEALPLINVLKSQALNSHIALYIEEPEAHLFPKAQKEVVQLLARRFNGAKKSLSDMQIFITTHSPYILAAFNNLLQAGRLCELKPARLAELAQIVPEAEQLSPNNLAAYAFGQGQPQDLIDAETGLIEASKLDEISNEIAQTFGDLLNLEFDEHED